MTTIDPRTLTDDEARACAGCLVWLAHGRFIEDTSGDIHADVALAYHDSLPPPGIGAPQIGTLGAFLAWMDGGDRLHRIGPDNPYGDNIEFYHADYAGAQTAAADMVKAYREGE